MTGLHPVAPEDKDLVVAFKLGEDGSYQAIHDRYSHRVVGICHRLLGDRHDAEEAAQETFMRVFTALPNFNGRYQLGAWMSRIATNVCLDHLRSQTRRPSDSVDNETLARLPQTQVNDGPEDLMVLSTERARVRAVLEGLSPMHRAAIALREFEGMSYNDIAVALGMTEPQVKALLHRARKSFKKSWTSAGVASFLPWRAIARLKRGPAGDTPPQFTDVAASGMHFATSCSTMLQQCGHFVTDRVATAVTALVVGTAALGAVVAPSGGGAAPPENERAQRIAVADPSDDAGNSKAKAPRDKVAATTEKQPAEAAAPTTNDDPTEGSEPDEEPAVEPSPSPSSPGQTPREPKPSPSPAPFMAAVGFDRGTPPTAAAPSARHETVDCDPYRLDQRLDIAVGDGSTSYPGVLMLTANGETAKLDLAVRKGDTQYWYTSWGESPVATWSWADRGLQLQITGSYGPRWDSDPESAGLPHSGTFSARLLLYCATSVSSSPSAKQSQVISESVALAVR